MAFSNCSRSNRNNGKFSLFISNPKPTDSLQFSLIGLETETRNVYESEELAVFMKEDFTMLGMTLICAESVRTVRSVTLGGAITVGVPARRTFWQRIKDVFRKN